MFQTMISIDDSLPGLKPGMSAEVTIEVEAPVQNALLIPVPAVVGSSEQGRLRKVYVMTASGPELIDIEIGQSNDTQVEVKTGLTVGQEIVLNPKALIGDKLKTRSPVEEKATGGSSGGKDGKGGGGYDPSKVKKGVESGTPGQYKKN